MEKTEAGAHQPSKTDGQCEIGKQFSTLELLAADLREHAIKQEPHFKRFLSYLDFQCRSLW